VSDPSVPITRWQGTTTLIGLTRWPHRVGGESSTVNISGDRLGGGTSLA